MATDHGEAFILPGTPVLKGGPNTWYLDFAGEQEPEPPTSNVKVWDGTQWATGAKSWDGTAWVPLKVWDGTAWVE